MRYRSYIAALLIGLVAWTIALEHLRSPSSAAVVHLPPVAALDESRIAERPVAYDVLEAASVRSTGPLLSFSSEHGTLTVRTLIARRTLSAALTAASLENTAAMFSVRPVSTSGINLWQRRVPASGASFETVTSTKGITVQDDHGHPVCLIRATPPEYSITVDTRGNAKLTSRLGKVVWTGVARGRLWGPSVQQAARSVSLDFNGLSLSFQGEHLLRLSTHDSQTDASRSSLHDTDSWSGRTIGPVTVIAVKWPETSVMIGVWHRDGQKSSVIYWQPGIRARSTISIDHCRLTVADDSGKVSGRRTVEIGTMTTQVATVSQPHMSQGINAGPSLTPVAPLYVPGDQLHANYTTATGHQLARETIEYKVAEDGRATVCRTMEVFPDLKSSRGARFGTTSSAMYAAPVSPFATAWHW